MYTAMKSMLKDNMISKNQVHHIRAERDILTESENPWIVTLYYSFQVNGKRVLTENTCVIFCVLRWMYFTTIQHYRKQNIIANVTYYVYYSEF